MVSAAGKKTARIAVLGVDTLLGRELVEVLGSTRITSFSSSGEGSFAEEEGEAVFVQPLDAAALAAHNFIVLAGAAEGARKVYDLAQAARSKPVLVDLTGDLENQPEARIAGVYVDEEIPAGWLIVPPQPAAQALALVLSRAATVAPVRQSIAHIFEPASERGRKGIAELQSQTTNLLSFKPLEKAVYDAQLAFNLLAKLGEDAPASLASIEQRIEKHLATLLSRLGGNAIPMPSLRVLQAPVFHGYSISLWLEFDRNIAADDIRRALATAQIELRAPGEETPDVVSAAGQSGLIAGDIRTDRNNGRAVWIWLVADNLRVLADSAASIVGSGAK